MTGTEKKRTRKTAPARVQGDASDSSLRVVDNRSDQSAEDIPAATIPGPAPAASARIVATPGDLAVEEILPKPPEGSDTRLANGFRVVENRAYQCKERIVSRRLRVPADDEIGYKKLFTTFEEAFVTRDIVALRGCLSPAFTWKLPNGQIVHGREAALDEMERRFAMPDGPRFSKSIWRFEGTTVLQTYSVDYRGPDGRWRQSRGFDLYEIGDGLITLKDAYWKMIP